MTEIIKVDVSVNITVHNEGLLVYKTLRTIRACIIYATKRGLEIESNISLDCADETTKIIIEDFIENNPELKVNSYVSTFGDISLSRNNLIQKSHGKYISFFDGDDFFTENYIYEAFQIAESHDKPAIYSPRYLIVFEGDHYLVEKQDSGSFDNISVNLFETNYYIGQSFVHHKIYEHIKYQPTGDGFGMEDWHFSCEATALGYLFHNVPNTIFFYRRKKSGSLLASFIQSLATIRTTKLFTPSVFASLPFQPKVLKETPNYAESHHQISSRFRRGAVALLQKNEPVYKYVKLQYKMHRAVLGVLMHRGKGNNATLKDRSYVPDVSIPSRLKEIGFTEELVHFWGRLNEFEPMIRSSSDMRDMIPIVGYPLESKMSEGYHNLCVKYQHQKNVKDIVLVPHLIKGGADFAAISLVKELSKSGTVMVITTIDVDSPWLDRLRNLENVICIELKDLLEGVDENGRILFILRILQHWGVERLNIINSEVGYKLVKGFYNVIKQAGCKIYLHTYAFDMTSDGYLYNVIPNGLVYAYDSVDIFFTDSIAYKKQLRTINGFDEAKIGVLYLPLSTEIVAKKDYSIKRKVLWASRINESKLIEVMAEVGKLLGEHNIELHVFGTIDKDYAQDNRFMDSIQEHESIHYRGDYDGFSSLDVNEFDMFLMTSKNEGMPNVILEACMANIFIVAPSVGGIPECITHGKNGNIVTEKFNPKAYVAQILDAYATKNFIDQQSISHHNSVITTRHSLKNYEREVHRLMDIN